MIGVGKGKNKNRVWYKHRLNGDEGDEVMMFRVCQVKTWGQEVQTEETTHASFKV